MQTFPENRVGAALMEDIMERFDETSAATAYKCALDEIKGHFAERRARLPYKVSFNKRQFTALDNDYVEFVAFARSYRGVGGKPSKEFEIRTVNRLRTRLTGDLSRVGVPRDRLKKKGDVVAYLGSLGFDKNCLEARDKDGGLDILWLPPLGAVPLRPVVSLQCKNAFFDEHEADASTARAARTLNRHSHIRGGHLKFVVFNDYIDRKAFQGRAVGWTFMPLGLTDLAALSGRGTVELL